MTTGFSRVAGSRRPGAHFAVDIAFPPQQDGRADVGTVIAPQTFFGNVHIVGDLPLQHFLHILQIHGIRKRHDALNRKAASVDQAVLTGHTFLFQQCFPIPADTNQVGVVVHNADKSTVLPVKCGDLNVKNVGSVHAVDCDGSAVQIGGSFRNLRLRHTRNDLQLRIRQRPHCIRHQKPSFYICSMF